jgi:hypothetical protein
MEIQRMVQLALGVVDAVPAKRRPAVAVQRLASLAGPYEIGISKAELDAGCAEVVKLLADLYVSGNLDAPLCGLNGSVDPVLWITSRVTKKTMKDIGQETCDALAAAAINALTTWAQAHPILDT